MLLRARDAIHHRALVRQHHRPVAPSRRRQVWGGRPFVCGEIEPPLVFCLTYQTLQFSCCTHPQPVCYALYLSTKERGIRDAAALALRESAVFARLTFPFLYIGFFRSKTMSEENVHFAFPEGTATITQPDDMGEGDSSLLSTLEFVGRWV